MVSGQISITYKIINHATKHVFATVCKLDDGINQITHIAINENLPLQVIQLDVNNDKSVT
jgi:hypothetical protein